MSVTIAKNAGFCFGVKRATDCVSALLTDAGVHKIYTLGALIHNGTYIKELESKGVFAIRMEDAARIARESNVCGKTVLLIRAQDRKSVV